MKSKAATGTPGSVRNGGLRRKKTVFLKMRRDKGIVVQIDTRTNKRSRKVHDLSRNPQYRDWLQMGEACAIIRRTPRMFLRYRNRGIVRAVRVYRHDPRRWYWLFNPEDVRELAENLRRKDAVGFQMKDNLDRIADTIRASLP